MSVSREGPSVLLFSVVCQPFVKPSPVALEVLVLAQHEKDGAADAVERQHVAAHQPRLRDSTCAHARRLGLALGLAGTRAHGRRFVAALRLMMPNPHGVLSGQPTLGGRAHLDGGRAPQRVHERRLAHKGKERLQQLRGEQRLEAQLGPQPADAARPAHVDMQANSASRGRAGRKCVRGNSRQLLAPHEGGGARETPAHRVGRVDPQGSAALAA